MFRKACIYFDDFNTTCFRRAEKPKNRFLDYTIHQVINFAKKKLARHQNSWFISLVCSYKGNSNFWCIVTGKRWLKNIKIFLLQWRKNKIARSRTASHQWSLRREVNFLFSKYSAIFAKTRKTWKVFIWNGEVKKNFLFFLFQNSSATAN